jgi:hypothetical protein
MHVTVMLLLGSISLLTNVVNTVPRYDLRPTCQSYRRILVTEGIRRQRLELAI